MWARVMVTRLVGNKEGKGKGSKGKSNGNEGGKHWREGKSGKAMARVVGKQMATALTRAMVTKTKEADEEEVNHKGIKSDGNGKEDGDGKQWWWHT
jgi:hypothetical protein